MASAVLCQEIKRLVLGGTVAVLAVGWAGAAAADTCSALRATAHPDYQPYSWNQGDALVGAVPDVALRLAAEIGIDLELIPAGNWNRAIDMGRRGQVDLIMALKYTNERARYFAYTDTPFYSNDTVLFVPANSSFAYTAWSDLKDTFATITLGDRAGGGFDKFLFANANVRTASTLAENFLLLDRGEADYLVKGRLPGLTYLTANGTADRYKILEPPVADDPVYFAMSRSSPCLDILSSIELRLAEYLRLDIAAEAIERNIGRWASVYARQLAP